ncbi:MAG TPA: FAD-binding oxidoreductase, partial [Chitinophagaceae bacterium]
MIATTTTSELIKELQTICGEANVFFDDESLKYYGHDETEKLLYPPDVAVKPATAEEISKILRYCNEHLIPVTPRGAGTGLSGGAIPQNGGVVISIERLNKIIEIDERNLQVMTEPGVITEVLQNTVKEKG